MNILRTVICKTGARNLTSSIRALCLLMAASLVTGCHAKREAASTEKQLAAHANIEIIIDQPIDTLLENYPSTFSTECLAPVDICWHTVTNRFSSSDLPSVTVKGEAQTLLTIQDVGDLTVVINKRRGPEIRDVSLTIRALPDDSLHSEQKDFIYQILRQLMSSGWEHMYRFPAARIPGSESHKLNDAENVLGEYALTHPWFDPRIEASIEQWIQYGSAYSWFFYQVGTYLNVSIQRRDSQTEPKDRGTYLIQIKLMDESSYWRQHFSGEQLNNWQQLLPELLEQYRQSRESREAKARAAGIKIEESYQDPPIKALSMGRGTQP